MRHSSKRHAIVRRYARYCAPLAVALLVAATASAQPAADRQAAEAAGAAADEPGRGASGERDEPTAPAESTAAELRARLEQLDRRVADLEQRNDDLEIDLIRMQADAEAAGAGEAGAQAEAESDTSARVFRGGQRALQALNPEISAVADVYAQGVIDKRGYAQSGQRSGFFFRSLGLHLQSDLDPFSLLKVAIDFGTEGVDLEEAYVTWTSVLPGVSFSFGKFRQPFGVVNRWHEESLDQIDYPLALREAFGEEGLAQTGVSLEWLMPPMWADANTLVLQITNGENERALAGQWFSIPTGLLRLQSYYDLSESAYFELGLDGLVGWHNASGRPNPVTGVLEDEPWRPTVAWGADWTVQWEPLRQAKYRNVVARGEIYGVRKWTVAAPPMMMIGGYQYLQTKLTRSWDVGARVDWMRPYAPDGTTEQVFGAMPYLTWWQSPWVRLRLHYAAQYDERNADAEHRVMLQLTAAAGPHKHERY